MLNPKNWDKISIGTYNEIYKEAKTRYEDLLSESQSITDKAIKLTILLFGLAAWASSLFASWHKHICLVFCS